MGGLTFGTISDVGKFMILGSKSIAQAVFVIGYARDATIRTRQFEIEKAMTPLIGGPSVNTNLPDDSNPHAPRVTLSHGAVTVHFSQMAAQITINVDNTDNKSLEVIRDSISKRINMFQSCLDKIIPHEQQRERGLVLTVQYPVDLNKVTDDVVFEYIQSKFLRITPLGTAASAGFNVGYKTADNFFITLNVGQYKMATAEVPITQSVSWFDIAALPVVESGIELKIDVNSRPWVDKPNKPKDETGVIMKKSFDFVLSEADSFMGIA